MAAGIFARNGLHPWVRSAKMHDHRDVIAQMREIETEPESLVVALMRVANAEVRLIAARTPEGKAAMAISHAIRAIVILIIKRVAFFDRDVAAPMTAVGVPKHQAVHAMRFKGDAIRLRLPFAGAEIFFQEMLDALAIDGFLIGCVNDQIHLLLPGEHLARLRWDCREMRSYRGLHFDLQKLSVSKDWRYSNNFYLCPARSGNK